MGRTASIVVLGTRPQRNGSGCPLVSEVKVEGGMKGVILQLVYVVSLEIRGPTQKSRVQPRSEQRRTGLE